MECIKDHIVKTRKLHRCVGCYGLIFKGSWVRCQTVTSGGGIFNVYICDICEEIIEIKGAGEFCEGELIENYNELYNCIKAGKEPDCNGNCAVEKDISWRCRNNAY